MAESTVNRYGAKLLFQFRTEKKGVSNKRRVCEERIVIINSKTPDGAFKAATKRGKSEEFSYPDSGSEVFFEFIGIVDLIDLGMSSEDDEVWWSFSEKILPKENSNKLIPSKEHLSVFCDKSQKNKRAVKVP